MSKLTTKLFGSDLVDEGLEVQRLEERVEELEKLLASQKLVCKICEQELKMVNYTGYYDKFACWVCDCDSFKDANKMRGGFA